MTPSKSMILSTILALQLVATDGAFMGAGKAGKSALFKTKVTNHEEDLELTRRIIMSHVGNEKVQKVVKVPVEAVAVEVVEAKVEAVAKVEVEAPVALPVVEEIAQVELEAEVEIIEEPSSSSSSSSPSSPSSSSAVSSSRRSNKVTSQEKIRSLLTSSLALSSTVSFIRTSKLLRVVPSVKGTIIRAVKKTTQTTANVANSIDVNAAASQTASLTLQLTDRGVKNVLGAAGRVVDWCVPTSLNLGETSTYRVARTTTRRRSTSTSTKSNQSGISPTSPSIMPLSSQLGNVRTLNKVVKEMIFLLQQM